MYKIENPKQTTVETAEKDTTPKKVTHNGHDYTVHPKESNSLTNQELPIAQRLFGKNYKHRVEGAVYTTPTPTDRSKQISSTTLLKV